MSLVDTYKKKKDNTTVVLCNHMGRLMDSVRFQPPRLTHTLTNRHKCCHSSSPLSLIIGGWGTQCRRASVCVSTDSLAWWKMLTFNVLFFTLFIKHKATDLTGPLDLTPPVSLTVPLSFSVPLSFCLWPWKNWLRKRERQEGFQWSPLAPYEVVLSRLNMQHFLLQTLTLEYFTTRGYLVLSTLFCFEWTLIIYS